MVSLCAESLQRNTAVSNQGNQERRFKRCELKILCLSSQMAPINFTCDSSFSFLWRIKLAPQSVSWSRGCYAMWIKMAVALSRGLLFLLVVCLKKLTDFGSNSNMIIFLKRLVIFPPFFVSFWAVNMAFWRIIWRRLIFNVNSHDYVLRSYWLLYLEDVRFTGTHAGWSIFF